MPLHTFFRPMLACLLVMGAALPASAATAAKAPIAGTDYVEIPGGQPFSPQDGRIEVVEIFGYTCPACAHFQPRLDAWKSKQDEDVKLVPVPAPFGGHWMPYAKAYFAAQSLGLADKTHNAMFRALHEDGSLPISGATPQEIAGFYAGHGADRAGFIEAYESPAVQARLKQARAFIDRSFGEAPAGTPTVVVAGRYRVTGASADDVLHIVDQLVERERKARGR